MVHVYLKENGVYKVRVFFNAKSIFNDAIAVMEETISDYEKEYGELEGERDRKAVLLPKDYLRTKGYELLEKPLSMLEVEEILKYQEIVEI